MPSSGAWLDIDTVAEVAARVSMPGAEPQQRAEEALAVLQDRMGAEGSWLRFQAPGMRRFAAYASVGPPPPGLVRLTPAEARSFEEGKVLSLRLPEQVSGPGSAYWAKRGFGGMVVAPFRVDDSCSGAAALLFRGPAPEICGPTLRVAVPLLATVLHRALVAPLGHDTEDSLRLVGQLMERRDVETVGHTERVIELSRSFAQSLGVARDSLAQLEIGAALHDIGKLAIPDDILKKPDRLDQGEWAAMKRHVELGVAILERMAFVGPDALDVVRHHHERWDGRGYPDGLAGEQIPLGARIFALVDVYDALRSRRPYKEAWCEEMARAIVLAEAGRHFDPELTRHFLAFLAPRA